MNFLLCVRRHLLIASLAASGFACISGTAISVHAGEIILMDKIVNSIQPKTRGITVEPVTASRRLALSAIQFEFNSTRFTLQAQDQMTELGKALLTRELLPYSFTLAGHTDSVGSRFYNRDLSLRRAQAVKRYLMDEMGIAGERLVEVGFGEDYPITGLVPDNGRNRRVEVSNIGALGSDSINRASSGRAPAKRALLIGIGAYQNVASLNGSVSDAKNMAKFLVERVGYTNGDVRLLLDSDATRKGILGAMDEWLIAGTKPGDEIFLYYSGHGFQTKDIDGDESDHLDETLVPVDVSLDRGGLIDGMITDDEIAVLLGRLSGRRIRVVIDACHSGTSTRSAAAGARQYMKTPRNPDGSPLRVSMVQTRGVGGVAPDQSLLPTDDPNIEVWSAVRADQIALLDREADEEGGSVFTRRLLWGVRDSKADADRDGTVTVAELQRYITQESNAYCQRYPHDCPRGLTPQIQTPSNRLGAEAFADNFAKLPRIVTMAKNLLIRASADMPQRQKDDLRVWISHGSKLKIGNEVDISVTSNRSGHLVVLDMDAAGNLVQIFPNDTSLRAGVSSRIRVGETVALPGKEAGFRFRTVPPAGRGLLVALVSDRNERLEELVSRHKDLSVVPSPERYIAEIEAALRSGTATRPSLAGWSIASFEYTILRPENTL